MNTRTRVSLAGAAGVLGLVIALAAPGSALAENPPATAEGQYSAPPSPAYVWMSGHWNSDNGRWAWVAAHWELPPSRSATWVTGHWVPQAGSWVWANGAWNLSEPPQSQEAPPQPPAQGSSPEAQSVPMPSTPPPLIGGAYGPDGVVRAIDLPPTTADYGPIEYAAPGPGYNYWAGDPYWAGDSFLWGYPGPYFGLGWGPAFYEGYYGRGFRGGGREHGHGGHPPGAHGGN